MGFLIDFYFICFNNKRFEVINICVKSWIFVEFDNSNIIDKIEDCGEFGVLKLVIIVLSG